VTFHDPCGFGSKQVYQPCAKVTTKCISTFGNKYVSQPCANFTTKCISAFSTCDEASVRLPPSSAKHFAFLRQMQQNIFKKLETNKRKTRILPFLELLAAIQARRVLSSLARTRKWTRCKVFAWYCSVPTISALEALLHHPHSNLLKHWSHVLRFAQSLETRENSAGWKNSTHNKNHHIKDEHRLNRMAVEGP